MEGDALKVLSHPHHYTFGGFFETGSLYIALSVLELIIQTTLTSNSEVHLPVTPEGWDVCHIQLNEPFSLVREGEAGMILEMCQGSGFNKVGPGPETRVSN